MGTALCLRVAQHSGDQRVMTFVPKPLNSRTKASPPGAVLRHTKDRNDNVLFFFFLVGYVEERLWWPIQSPNIGTKKKEEASS